MTPHDQSITYGSAVPGPGFYTFDVTGFVNHETADDAVGYHAPTCASAYTRTTPASLPTIPISCSGGSATNYVFDTSATESLTINKAAVTVTANNKTMTYGGTVPAFMVTVTGLVNDDTFASLGGSCSASVGGNAVGPSTPAGTYAGAITCSGITSSNYTVTYHPGTLTIQRAALTVTADDQSVQYSDRLLTLTASYAGFVLGQGPSDLSGSLACSTEANVSGGQVLSPAGTYPITCTGLSSANYLVTFKPGTLTVTREDAVLRLAQNNPHAVPVDTSGKNKGKAPAMTFSVRLTEVPDGSYGDITKATPVTLVLDPVSGGSGGTGTCTVSKTQAATSTSPGSAALSCVVDAGMAINVYEVSVSVGGTYYQGSDASVLTVYDPTAGGSTGAGTITNPNTDWGADIAYSSIYLKNGKSVQGKFLYISRDADGNVVHVFKGNVMSTLAVTGTSYPKTAMVTGKATLDGVGNYSYILTGIDAHGPGNAVGDQFGLRVTDSSDNPVDDLTFDPLDLLNGDIFVGK